MAGRGVRIIGGTFARRRVAVPSGDAVRPTSERVREALFAILGGPWEERLVLDLFAGSGALGLESLSRGAARAVFVERDHRVASIVRSNIETLGVGDRAHVLVSDALRALRRLTRDGARFDVVWLDPPYASDLLAKALDALGEGTLLNEETIVVAEHPPQQALTSRVGRLRATESRTYGSTAVTVFEVEKA